MQLLYTIHLKLETVMYTKERIDSLDIQILTNYVRSIQGKLNGAML